MSSLQDQLLKTGLVDKSKANKAKKQKQKQASTARKSGGKVVDDRRVAAQQAQAQKALRDRELNRQKELKTERKALMAQIKQLITLNRVECKGGDIAYSFIHHDKVRQLYVDGTLQPQLVQGRLAIACYKQGKSYHYDMIPLAIADKIAQRNQASIVQMNKRAEASSESDPYADYQIPDDLMW